MPLSHLGRYVGAPGRRVLGAVFPLLRRLKPARERVVLGEYGDEVEREHVARYEFARGYCADKAVADIACGSGYGSDILRQVAASVDGYDRVPLCGNIVLDLEQEAWHTFYDVIVSFETIEHLANPDFFLGNVARTSPRLIVSSPIGEFMGYNPHHKQTWELPQFKALLEPRFQCRYFYQEGVSIAETPTAAVSFVIAVCDRRAGPG
jgi:2-polyprenyl-3-methyl-5-hydroxy-6-metoxy-1,4-benzoquinol methylase